MFELRGNTIYFNGQVCALLTAMPVGLRRDVEDALGVNYMQAESGFIDTDAIEAAKEIIEDMTQKVETEVKRLREFIPDIDVSTLMGVCAEANIYTASDNLDEFAATIKKAAEAIDKELYE